MVAKDSLRAYKLPVANDKEEGAYVDHDVDRLFLGGPKAGADILTVRARTRKDLDNLRDLYLPELSQSIGHIGTDYPWRAEVPHVAFAAALSKMTLDIDYPNFKVRSVEHPGAHAGVSLP